MISESFDIQLKRLMTWAEIPKSATYVVVMKRLYVVSMSLNRMLNDLVYVWWVFTYLNASGVCEKFFADSEFRVGTRSGGNTSPIWEIPTSSPEILARSWKN